MDKQFDVDNEIEIDLRELLMELLAYWKLILVSMALVGLIFFSVSKFLITPKYESTSVLYVLTKSASITSLADLETGASLTNDYMVVVKSRPVLDQVIENLNLGIKYAELERTVSLNNPSNSRLLEITVRHENPDMAKAIADEIAEVSSAFIAAKMDQDPPTISQYGYADGTAVTPNVKKNTAIGAIFGGLLAAAIVVIAYLFNDTIIDPEDIEKKLGLNVLGTLPLEEAEYDGETKKKAGKTRKK